MSDSIVVRYASIEQVIGDIRALQALAENCAISDLGMSQSKGPGKDAICEAAEALNAATESLTGLLQRSCDYIGTAEGLFKEADESIANEIEENG